MSEAYRYEVVSSTERFHGHVIAVRTDVVEMPGGGTAERDVVVHPGAVGVVALDEAGQVLLLRQYRHPVRDWLWELPAGIRDVADEPLVVCARRELHEEAALLADSWAVLVDVHATPGCSDEWYRVFLARGLREVPLAQREQLRNEELEMQPRWVDLEQACAWVLDGRITNAMCAIGVLAAARAGGTSYAGLRPAD